MPQAWGIGLMLTQIAHQLTTEKVESDMIFRLWCGNLASYVTLLFLLNLS